eukprot:Clim_evm7s148 gene=Clim_evmTU7s148
MAHMDQGSTPPTGTSSGGTGTSVPAIDPIALWQALVPYMWFFVIGAAFLIYTYNSYAKGSKSYIPNPQRMAFVENSVHRERMLAARQKQQEKLALEAQSAKEEKERKEKERLERKLNGEAVDESDNDAEEDDACAWKPGMGRRNGSSAASASQPDYFPLMGGGGIGGARQLSGSMRRVGRRRG